MIIEDRFLNYASLKFKKMIIALKRDGVNTEPAFAKLLNLNGNHYEALLNLEFLTDKEIIDKLRELG